MPRLKASFLDKILRCHYDLHLIFVTLLSFDLTIYIIYYRLRTQHSFSIGASRLTVFLLHLTIY